MLLSKTIQRNQQIDEEWKDDEKNYGSGAEEFEPQEKRGVREFNPAKSRSKMKGFDQMDEVSLPDQKIRYMLYEYRESKNGSCEEVSGII